MSAEPPAVRGGRGRVEGSGCWRGVGGCRGRRSRRRSVTGRVFSLASATRPTEAVRCLPSGAARAGLRGGPEHRHRVRLGSGAPDELPDPRRRAGRAPGGCHRHSLVPGRAGAPQSATATIPIVMVTSSDPVGGGLVASLGAPGGNVTGSRTSVGSWPASGWSCSRRAVPRHLPRGHALGLSANLAAPPAGRESESARAGAGRAAPHPLEVRGPDELDGAFRPPRRRAPRRSVCSSRGLLRAPTGAQIVDSRCARRLARDVRVSGSS